MLYGRQIGIWDDEVTGVPNCTTSGQPMKYRPDDWRTGITAIDETHWLYHLSKRSRGTWWCGNGCLSCPCCGGTFRKGETCDRWSCRCCTPQPGQKVIRLNANRKGEPCGDCGCAEGSCNCTVER